MSLDQITEKLKIIDFFIKIKVKFIALINEKNCLSKIVVLLL